MEKEYSIPAKHRRMENLHVVFWLFKDLSWCLVWRTLGIIMIFPTLTLSVWITWKSWHIMSERCHNIAVTAWICANAYWMTSEFLKFDETIVFGNVHYKQLTLIPFFVGVLSLSYYYIIHKLIKKQAS